MKDEKSRERLTLTVGAVIVIIIIYLGLFLIPTKNEIKKTKKQITLNSKKKKELKILLEKHQKFALRKKKGFEESLSAFIEKKAKSIKIQIAYIRPYGEKGEGVEIKVEEITGKKLLEFIYVLESENATVTRLYMRDYKGTGIWVVKMNIEV